MGKASGGSCLQLGRPGRSVGPGTFYASSIIIGATSPRRIHRDGKPLQADGSVISGSGSVFTHPVRVKVLLRRCSVLAMRAPTQQHRTCAPTNRFNPAAPPPSG